VWASFNLRNILLQNGFIENMKPITQIWNHHKPTPHESRWGTIIHKEEVYTTKKYW
jgi:hypothetical protein